MEENTQCVELRSKGGRPHVSHYEDFLRAYFSPDSPSRGNASASARSVGITERAGRFHMQRFRRIGPSERMKHAFADMGLDEWLWAANIKDMVNDRVTYKDGSTHPTPVTVEGTKLLGRALGCIVPDSVQVQQVTQNISGGPVMIVVGASDQRFKQLEAGALEAEIVEENNNGNQQEDVRTDGRDNS